MALILSNFGKLLLILMIIWDYNELEYSWLVSIFALTSNIEAISVVLHEGYLKTMMFLGGSMICKLFVQFLIRQFDSSQKIILV